MPPSSPANVFEPLPRLVRYLLVAISACVLLSGLGMLIAVVAMPPTPVWVVFGLESVIAVSGVIGVLAAMRRFEQGQGLAWWCVSGTLLVSGFLEFLGTRQGIVFAESRPTSMNPWVAGRMVLGVVFGLVAAYAVLRRDPRSLSYLTKAAATGAPLVIVLVVGYVFRSTIRGVTANVPGVILGGVAALLGVVAIVLFSASVHCLIRAFEVGRRDSQPV